jgi:hypothetical protein
MGGKIKKMFLACLLALGLLGGVTAVMAPSAGAWTYVSVTGNSGGTGKDPAWISHAPTGGYCDGYSAPCWSIYAYSGATLITRPAGTFGNVSVGVRTILRQWNPGWTNWVQRSYVDQNVTIPAGWNGVWVPAVQLKSRIVGGAYYGYWQVAILTAFPGGAGTIVLPNVVGDIRCGRGIRVCSHGPGWIYAGGFTYAS